MSWQSSAEYYRLINEAIQARLGGHHNGRTLMFTVNFEEIEPLMRAGDWDGVAAIVTDAARKLEAGGADFILLCTNTIHKVSDAIEAAISIPFVHLVDVTAEAVQRQGCHTVGLLGTRFTMEQEFYRARLERHGLTVLIPDAEARDTIHRVIFEELVFGKVHDQSRRQYQAIIHQLRDRGAEGVILGCTEIGLLIQSADSSLPVFDTTRIHVEAAVALALA